MQERIRSFEEILTQYSPEEKEKIVAAALWAEKLHREQRRASGEPYFIHPLQVAEILVSLRMDGETIIAALLHDILEDTEMTRLELRRQFGKDVESLVNGVTKISILKAKNKTVQEAETIRKMLFAMVKDIRVILIKLADKLHNMRTLDFLPEEKRKSIATECLDIYAPLAGRLGISWLKDELEDLSLKHLNRDVYDQIKTFVAQKKGERAKYLERVRNDLMHAAEEESVSIEIDTRAKHFYSIYQKMKKRQKPIDEIFDLLGIRVLCETANQCYTILGLVHRLWRPIDGRFKDYIAMPKANKYQSLHTTVMCYDGKLIEIQIRTKEMHGTAEYGIAAHWIYKKGFTKEIINSDDLPIINRLKSWNGVRITSGEFLEEIKRELLKDSIYVFTPRGDVFELPKGSTAIDFAYHIHTEIGNHCIGAKADGSIIQLRQELKNTQVIEILTSPTSHPHLNWLRYARTRGARQKIRQWINKHDESLIIDRNIVARKSPSQTEQTRNESLKEKSPEPQQITDLSKVGIRIGNERNMMIRLAQCCTPSTGDDIIGYISRGRGIIVHKKTCPNLQYIHDFAERKIETEWETVSPKATRRFKITAHKISDLFSEIEGAVKKFHGHLIEGKLEENDTGNLTGFFSMEIERGEDFARVMKSIRTIPSVMNIQEVHSDMINTHMP